MSTKIERSYTRLFGPKLLVASLLTVIFSGVSVASPEGAVGNSDEAPRSSESKHIVQGGRDNPTVQSKSTEEYDALKITGERNKSGTRAGFAKPGAGSSSAQSTSFDFWIYDADVQLFSDHDGLLLVTRLQVIAIQLGAEEVAQDGGAVMQVIDCLEQWRNVQRNLAATIVQFAPFS